MGRVHEPRLGSAGENKRKSCMFGWVLKSARKCHKFAFITFFAGCIQLTSTLFTQINGRVDYGDMTVEPANEVSGALVCWPSGW